MIKEILKVLPGGDCGGYGGCGFETCEACAEAIASGGSGKFMLCLFTG